MLATYRVARICVVAAAFLVPSLKIGLAADLQTEAVKSGNTEADETATATLADGTAAEPKTDPAAKKESDAIKDSTSTKDSADSAGAAKVERKKVKVLSAEMIQRRDRVRQLLTALRPQPFNTQQNTCTDILDFCRAFGCQTEVTDNATSGQKLNGITCLCWNMPCGGYEMLTVSGGHLAPRVGYGYQDNSSELAAVLALARVPADYPARAGKTVRTVGDLIEYEKLTCRPGLDMSLKLVALANYVQQPSWKDSLGSEWTLQRVVAEELGRPQGTHPHAATDRLLGIAAALERFRVDKIPLDGDLARAKSYVDESIEYAYSTQNSDGSWGRPTNRDYAAAVASSAHMLEWLAIALPAGRLEDPQIVRGVDFLSAALSSSHYQTYIPMMSGREISAAMHAAYVLNAYDQRVFVPADPLPGAETAKTQKAEPKADGTGTVPATKAASRAVPVNTEWQVR